MMTNEQVLQKMEEDFLLRGSSQETRRTYRTALIRFSAFAAKDRYSDLNEKDLRSFLLHLHQQGKLQGTSINTYNAGCKFFLEVVLGLAINRKQVPNVRARHKQPVHFRVEQLEQFFAHLNEIRAFAFFLTLFAIMIPVFLTYGNARKKVRTVISIDRYLTQMRIFHFPHCIGLAKTFMKDFLIPQTLKLNA